ncbi:hypothetical protein BKA65DRAFT_267803 [Rhexocercosporidium sp. MPI-PUGE-AT-0058]|nr:hypothetical protein BKA65DRAFT_267803 [Rhexocercosporidium sp. MPI-PUGE-AT-0058]
MALHTTQKNKKKITNENKRFKCWCNKKFGRKSELNRHVKETHSGKKYSCPVPNCLFRTGRPGKVQEHLKKRHGTGGGGQRKHNTHQAIENSCGSSGMEYHPPNSQQEPTHWCTTGEAQSTEAFANASSTNTVLGSGRWVPTSQTERLETPPQYLELSQSTDDTHPSTTPASAEEFSLTNDLLGATEMLSLGDDCGTESIMDWMETSFPDGWDLNSWNP